MKGKIYIAYGSNMDFPQMEGRCPDAEFLGAGVLRNWRLMFKGSLTGSYATIEKVDEGRTAVRFCTSWATRAEDVDKLIADLRRLWEA